MLNRTSLQTVQALVELAKLPEGQWEGAASIARRIRAPENYLGKILQGLTAEGLVVSQKGFNGGFRLNKNPKDLTLFDVVDPIENIGRWEGCFLGKSKCSSSTPCAVHNRWARVRSMYVDFLKETSLQDLLK